jgi:hypothetical protein
MITKQEAADMIYAGVLGCLDRADQTKLNEFIRAGGELPSNMGELQNIAALLPIILQAENPDPKLKDMVARKLYRIKDQIRAKVTSENSSAGTGEVFYSNSREDRKSSSLLSGKPSTSSEEKKIKNEEKAEDNIVEEKPQNTELEQITEKEETPAAVKAEEIKSEDFEPVTPSRNTFESFKSTRERVLEGNFKDVSEETPEVNKEEIKPESKTPTSEKVKTYERVITKEKPSSNAPAKESPHQRISTKERGKSFERAYRKKYYTEETQTKKKGMSSWLVVSLFVILFLALVVLYMNFSTEIKDLKFSNDTLNKQLSELSVKFNNSQEIQNILESADVKIINLEGTAINPGGKGKLIISASQSKGYLQLTDMPALGQNSSYQLWMQLPDGKYFSLGVFNPSGRVQYFPFKIPQSEGTNVTEYLVTEESLTGATNPGNKVFLTGSIQ